MKTGQQINRRDFVGAGVAVAGAVALGIDPTASKADESSIPSYNPQMEYRRLGKTGLMVSCVGMGGHWKRIRTQLPNGGAILGNDNPNWLNNADFMKNRANVLDRCLEVGINFVDTVDDPEAEVYAKLVKDRRQKVYMGWSRYPKEPREPEFRTAKALMKAFDESLKQFGLEYVDWWRLAAYEWGSQHTFNDSLEIIAALDQAKQQGKARFTGFSSHDHKWIKMMIEQFPGHIDLVLFPYTSDTKALPKDSLFEAVRQHDVGVFGIKPFASNSLFKGDGSANSPHAEEDNQIARMAIRYILMNPAITAPIPGMISVAQVDNIAQAVREHRELDMKETAQLQQANQEMWARLPDNYQWLKKWEYV